MHVEIVKVAYGSKAPDQAGGRYVRIVSDRLIGNRFYDIWHRSFARCQHDAVLAHEREGLFTGHY